MTHVQLGVVCPVCGLMHMAPQGACDRPEVKVEEPKVEEPKVAKVEKKLAKKAAKKSKK